MANITLEQQLQRKILVIDGAMGTMIQAPTYQHLILAARRTKGATNI